MAWWENLGTKMYENLDLTKLGVDQAYLNVTNFDNSTYYAYSLSERCFKCPFSLLTQIGTNADSTIKKVDTTHNVTWRLYSRNDEIIAVNDTRLLLCEVFPKNFGEFGVYEWHINNGNCELYTVKQPVNTEFPLLVTILGIIILTCLYYIINNLICKMKKNKNSDVDDKEMAHRRSRVQAIDAFRGICLVFMIFVNDGGGNYWFFDHASWNGLLFADLFFPWFTWIMGVCIPIVVKSQLKKGTSRISMFRNVIWRSFMLFLLGLSLNTVAAGPTLRTMRIFGVLQRLAVGYFVVATISTFLTFRSHDILNKNSVTSQLKDIILLFPQWIPISLILAAHIYLTFYLPVPGCPLGYLGPGGIQDDGKYKNCTGGVSGYIDKLILGGDHIFQHPAIKAVYNSQPFDPEGLLGCLTSIFQVFLGVQAGAILVYHQCLKDKVRRWLVWGILCLIGGLILCEFRIEGGWIPINKNLWSISFVLITSGLGYIVLCLLYLCIDKCKCWNGAPFIYPGMNSILLYVGHTVTYKMFPWHWSLDVMNTHFLLMLEAIWGTTVWVYISYWLYTCQFFLKL